MVRGTLVPTVTWEAILNSTERGTDRSAVPLVLREVDSERLDLVRAFVEVAEASTPSGTWWELCDPAAPNSQPPDAVVVSVRRSPDVIELVLFHVAKDADAGTATRLVDQLVAILRRTDAQLICSSIKDGEGHGTLVSAGFIVVPERDADARELLVLQL